MSQRLHVVLYDLTELGILLHIDALAEALRHEVEVDTKASCQVYELVALATKAAEVVAGTAEMPASPLSAAPGSREPDQQ